jgi:hypothetical protein
MTREEFIKVLDEGGYSYEIVGNKIVVTNNRSVYLDSLKTLPPDVEFKNGGFVDLSSLTALPSGVEFKNREFVYLNSLKTLPPEMEFGNGGNIHLDSLTALPPGVGFGNKGDVYLESLIGGWFEDWGGNIQDIDYKRLLNKMVRDGLFS